ncbi:MAG: cytochrome c biogenesis protein ResB [Isosphaeraceae bacterium]|nr:cytochrome c biogenesis protein ResB [Isosphaeraceae bacterium]
MATAVRKPSPSPPPPGTDRSRPVLSGILGIFDAIYRFLASLKLAVFSLVSLAAVLSYATFFESWYGATAAREWVYQSKGFALLLAFLGANILCAALIRYPWKKRQIGFLITHTGLLTLLAGSWISVKSADEGQVGMLEGQKMNELVRRDAAVIRVRKIDSQTGRPDRDFGEYELPFTPGTFAWGPDRPKARGFFGEIAHAVTFGALDDKRGPEELLTRPADPFKLVVKAHLPASMWTVKHEPDPGGDPMLKLRPRFKGPGMPRFRDILADDDERWFTTEHRFQRAGKTNFPARFAFQYTERPDLVDDFLSPPDAKGPEGVARFRYQDKGGKTRTYDWALTGQEGKSLTLPDSDLKLVYTKRAELPARELPVKAGDHEMSLARLLGEPVVPIAQFQVRQGDGPAVDYYGWGSLPGVPNLIPSQREDSPAHGKPVVQINYFVPPVLGAQGGGLMGLVEVLGTKDGALYYRAFGRGEPGQEIGRLRGKPGPIKKGEDVTAFGGDKNSPMTMTFQVEEFLPAGREEEVCEPIDLPKGQKDNGIAASLVTMTVGSETKTFWVSRSLTLDKRWQNVVFPNGDTYEVSYDMDRKPLGFELTLDDFDRLFDPGTEQPSRFVSKVRLTDETQSIKNRPITIAMNEPLTHRNYTFYQSSYQPELDPRTNRETGRFISVLQVATDGGRGIKYAGCGLVVLGAMVQLVTRTGVFTDGGRRERARTAARAARHASANGTQHDDSNTTVTDVNEAEETL